MSEQHKHKTFNSLDEMLTWVAQARAAVQARTLHPRQEGIKYGDYALRFLDGLVIFVYAEPPEGESEATVAEYARKDRDEDMLFCMCYSTVVTRGEYGWLHRSVLWPLSEEVMVRAAVVDWDPTELDDMDRLMIEHCFHEVREAQS